jgi:flagellar L-ring protein precursor FlgH
MASQKTMYLVLAVGLLVISWAQAAPTNSLFLRAEQEEQLRKMRGITNVNGMQASTPALDSSSTFPTALTSREASSGILSPVVPSRRPKIKTSIAKASWIAVDKPSPKNIRVHDLVSIIVHESSKHTAKEDVKAEREYSIDAALKDWLRLSGHNLRPDKQTRGDPKVSFSFKRESEGKGDVKSQHTLTARIQAEVIDVLPNGNLRLEATHTVVTNEEETHITLTGICRSKDVGIDNKVLSDNLAQLEIRKMHKGIARDANKRGLLTGLIDMLAIF